MATLNLRSRTVNTPSGEGNTTPTQTDAASDATPDSFAGPSSEARFAVAEWTGEGEGEKALIYGPSGMGKTSLAALAPSPVFLGVDDGARKIRLPDGSPLRAITGVRSFADAREAIKAPGILSPDDTLVVDTVTRLEELAELYVFDNYKTEDRKRVTSLEGYGFGKGYRFLFETMRLFLQDLDGLVKRGVNVCLIAQESAQPTVNAEGLDYLQAGPKLLHNKSWSVRTMYCEWVDHVVRVQHPDTTVAAIGQLKNATKGKLVSTDTTRLLAVQGARHFLAKSRTLCGIEAVSFKSPSDDSLWQLLAEAGAGVGAK